MRLTITAALLLVATIATAQPADLPVMKSNQTTVSIQDGKVLKSGTWRLSPELKPDVYNAELIDGKTHDVTFISDVDRKTFRVELGKQYDFIIQRGEERNWTRIVGTRFVPAAVFDARYQKERRGKTFVEIPEVYELVNVAIAMTPTALAKHGLVFHHSDYHERMREWFDPYRDHPLIVAFEQELAKDRYMTLKMNGAAFEFDSRGKIVQSKVYDRTGWGTTNDLRPFLPLLQKFADDTKFREFFRRNRKTYDEQIAFYRDTANLAAMQRWLHGNFPRSADYDTVRVIFSPLVGFNQSSNWLESNGFKELQPHVNFPYPEGFCSGEISETAKVLCRGSIVFTELNHGYINPEADKYAARISKAVSNRDHWVDKAKGPNYYGGNAVFTEYMNWALVSLYTADAPISEEEKKVLIAKVDKMMVNGRSFPQFEKFDTFLVDLYRNRKTGQTLADLYPEIIDWFERNNPALAQ